MNSSLFWQLFTMTGNINTYLGYRDHLEKEKWQSENHRVGEVSGFNEVQGG